MHGPINVKSPNNISKWQIGFNSAFEGLKLSHSSSCFYSCKTQANSAMLTNAEILVRYTNMVQYQLG
jgi:hypothetical protein